MGGTASVPDSSPEANFAFLVTKDVYDRLQAKGESNDSSASVELNQQLMNRIRQVYDSSLTEFALPLEECQNPGVIHYKYTQLNANEKSEFDQHVLNAAVEREKKRKRQNQEKGKKEVFDDTSFSGTKEDSQVEREAAAFLRGGDDPDTSGDDFRSFPCLRQPLFQTSEECNELREAGVWRKFMGASDCCLYINTLSRQILSIRPEEYEDDGIEEVNTQELVDPSNGLPTVEAGGIPEQVHAIVTEAKKTPLLIDTTTEQITRTFYSYKGICEDVSGLIVPYSKSGIKRQDIMERLRKSLVSAMKSGVIFALYLGEVCIDHANFKKKLCNKTTFPVEVFQEGGARLLQPDYSDGGQPRYKKLFQEADLEHGEAVLRDGFQVVVISSLSAFDFQSKLEDSLPLGYMFPLFVLPA